MENVTYIVLDENEQRRNDVYRAFAGRHPVIPVESASEIGAAWPDNAWFLVHDVENLLDDLRRAFADRQVYHPIIVYSEVLDARRIVTAVHDGAVDFVLWPFDAATIEQSRARLSETARHRCEQISLRLALKKRLASLSAREAEVIRGVRMGHTTKEIARLLEISPRTVEIHRANALSKLGARNSADATRILVEAEDMEMPARAAA